MRKTGCSTNVHQARTCEDVENCFANSKIETCVESKTCHQLDDPVSTLQPRLYSLGETHLHSHPSPRILPITAEPSVLHTESVASSLGVRHSWPLSHPRLDFIFSITFLIFPSVERRWAGRGSSRDLASDWSAPCDAAQMK